MRTVRQITSMDLYFLSPQSEPVFGVEFLADFLKEAVAAIAGAGIGAWLGARFAFKAERERSNSERDLAKRAARNERELAVQAANEARANAAAELAGRRATAGNLAIFGLSQIYNDLATYKKQFLDFAHKSPAPWFWLPPSTIAERNYYHFDVPGLAFLFQSRTPAAPIMVMKLAIEQDRFATWLETLKLRAQFHSQFIPPVIERLQQTYGQSYQVTEAELREAVGDRVYAELRNYLADIENLLHRGLKSAKELGDELRTVLTTDLPGQIIIGFERADEIGDGSPMQARDEMARNEPPLPG
jgi:hypothetical protein